MTQRAAAGVAVSLQPRRAPLPACAAVATGAASRALARRLLANSDEQLGALRGVAGDSLVAVLGAAEALPWVDGVVYLGVDPEAPRLLLPTARAPALSPALLEAAVLRHVAQRFAAEGSRGEAPAPPFAVLERPRWVLSLARAAPIQRARLAAWLEVAP